MTTNSGSSPNQSKNSNRSWSHSLKNQTRQAVEELDCWNPLTESLHFKNTNGSFGHIKVTDLKAGRFIMHIEDSDECWTGTSIDDVLAAGWAID